ncbi:MAG: PilZ domain-containing protein [Elusimicrobiota bacterium]
MTEERRRFTRIEAKLLAYTDSGEDALGVYGRVRDVSLQGLFIEGAGGLDPGASCFVELMLGEPENEARVRCSAVVVRRDDSGIGVRFTQIDAEGLPHLINLILSNADVPDHIAKELDAVLGFEAPRFPKG